MPRAGRGAARRPHPSCQPLRPGSPAGAPGRRPWAEPCFSGKSTGAQATQARPCPRTQASAPRRPWPTGAGLAASGLPPCPLLGAARLRGPRREPRQPPQRRPPLIAADRTGSHTPPPPGATTPAGTAPASPLTAPGRRPRGGQGRAPEPASGTPLSLGTGTAPSLRPPSPVPTPGLRGAEEEAPGRGCLSIAARHWGGSSGLADLGQDTAVRFQPPVPRDQKCTRATLCLRQPRGWLSVSGSHGTGLQEALRPAPPTITHDPDAGHVAPAARTTLHLGPPSSDGAPRSSALGRLPRQRPPPVRPEWPRTAPTEATLRPQLLSHRGPSWACDQRGHQSPPLPPDPHLQPPKPPATLGTDPAPAGLCRPSARSSPPTPAPARHRPSKPSTTPARAHPRSLLGGSSSTPTTPARTPREEAGTHQGRDRHQRRPRVILGAPGPPRLPPGPRLPIRAEGAEPAPGVWPAGQAGEPGPARAQTQRPLPTAPAINLGPAAAGALSARPFTFLLNHTGKLET